MNLMELREVRKTYRQGGAWGTARTVTAVDGISLSIEPGRCLAVVGPSGSGKSTLGRLVLGLEKPDSGMVLFRGNPLHGLQGKEKRSARRNVQVVFQNSQGAVNPRFSAMKIIAEPLVNFDGLSGAALADRAGELLEMVGMAAGDMNKLPHQFSGGELQRICLARAIASKPDLIVLDEAVSSLDMLNQSRILRLLADIKTGTGTAFFFISHDLRAVSGLADSLVVVDNGRIAHAAPDIPALWKNPASAGRAFATLAAAILPPEPA